MARIYTRTGDDGTTGLYAGGRLLKFDLRVEAYGTVDETNAAIGLARVHTAGSEIDATLERIQHDLFDLGADLCTRPDEGRGGEGALRVTDRHVARIEAAIDRLDAALPPLKSFILPGGTPAAAHLHLARTICRRAERLMVELARKPGESVGEPALRYVNRLSDFLFVASRFANERGARDVLWVAGAAE